MITSKDLRIVSLAKKMFNLSLHPKYKMISIVTKGGRVLSVGTNKVNAPKRFTSQRPGMHLHAEIDSLLGLSKDKTKNSTIYICGETAAGNLMNTKPCNSCVGFATQMGVKRVVYMDNGNLKELE